MPRASQSERQPAIRSAHPLHAASSSSRACSAAASSPNRSPASAPRILASRPGSTSAHSKRSTCSASSVSNTLRSSISTLRTPRARNASAISRPWARVRTSTATSAPVSGSPPIAASPRLA